MNAVEQTGTAVLLLLAAAVQVIVYSVTNVYVLHAAAALLVS
jgi:hypothetical protein